MHSLQDNLYVEFIFVGRFFQQNKQTNNTNQQSDGDCGISEFVPRLAYCMMEAKVELWSLFKLLLSSIKRKRLVDAGIGTECFGMFFHWMISFFLFYFLFLETKNKKTTKKQKKQQKPGQCMCFDMKKRNPLFRILVENELICFAPLWLVFKDTKTAPNLFHEMIESGNTEPSVDVAHMVLQNGAVDQLVMNVKQVCFL